MSTDEQATSPAEAYQAYYGPAIFEPLSERVLAIAAPSPGDRILEVASGTGILTRRLASAAGPAGRVLGIDLNPRMVEVARRLGGTASIEYRQGDGVALDVADGGFDSVYCQQGLQFLPDRAAGAREMRRALDAGGRAIVAVWQGLDAHPLFAALAAAEEPHLAAAGVTVDPDELVAPFSFGDGRALVELLRSAGFGGVELHQVSIDARFADADHFVERMELAYAAVIPNFAGDPAAFAAYLRAIDGATRDIVASHRRGDEVIVPMHAHVAVAHAS